MGSQRPDSQSDQGQAAGALTPPPGNPKFPELDGLRGLAAVSVVIFHAFQFTSNPPQLISAIAGHLDVGVAIFFVLSGFLLFRPVLAGSLGIAKTTPTKTFLKRRALRLIPAYLLALAVLSTFPGLVFKTPFGFGEILLLQAYIPIPNAARAGIGPGWSISVEASFYVLLALYAAVTLSRWNKLGREQVMRNHVRVIAGLTAMSLLIRAGGFAFSQQHHWTKYFMLNPIWSTFAWFALGIALACFDCQRELGTKPELSRLNPNRLLWYAGAVISYALISATHSQGPEGNLLGFVLYGITAVCIVAPSTTRRSSDTTAKLPAALTGLGLVSYGIYLYHYPLLDWLHQHIALTGLGDFAVLAASGLGLATALGTASWFLVEERFLRLK